MTCFWPDCGGSVYRGCIGCEGDGRENKAARRTADAGKVRICGMVTGIEPDKPTAGDAAGLSYKEQEQK